jgi:hypothetical protein
MLSLPKTEAEWNADRWLVQLHDKISENGLIRRGLMLFFPELRSHKRNNSAILAKCSKRRAIRGLVLRLPEYFSFYNRERTPKCVQ